MTIKKTKPLSDADRTKRSNQRRKDAGLIHGKVWMHPDEAAKVRAYAAKQPKTKAILSMLDDALKRFWKTKDKPAKRMD